MALNLVFYWPESDEIIILDNLFVTKSNLKCLFAFKNEYGYESNSCIGFTHKELQELEFIGEL